MGTLDAGIGKISCKNKYTSTNNSSKTIDYASKKPLVSNNTNYISNFADWRNVDKFLCDDDADQQHFQNAEAQAMLVYNNFPEINIDKIYLDAFKKVLHPKDNVIPMQLLH